MREKSAKIEGDIVILGRGGFRLILLPDLDGDTGLFELRDYHRGAYQGISEAYSSITEAFSSYYRGVTEAA